MNALTEPRLIQIKHVHVNINLFAVVMEKPILMLAKQKNKVLPNSQMENVMMDV